MAGDDDATVDHALLCPQAEKAQREAANGLEQVEYIAELVDRGVAEVRESHLLELHRLAVLDIYPCAGSFRTMPVRITNSPHTPPQEYFVRQLSVDALDWINNQRGQVSALERAAYALWRFNWIHPFAGGNGRTSRALAYLIICAEDGAMMPGKPTLPALIYEARHEYVMALRAADAAEAASVPDFSVMTEFLKDKLMHQMAAAINRLSRPGR
jgi:Fic family protein